MKLIDADALIELIEGGTDLKFDEVTEKALVQMINEQDIAYDVKKVVEQLVDDSFVDYFEYYTDGGECLITISEAIDIVKMGGLDLGYNPYQE